MNKPLAIVVLILAIAVGYIYVKPAPTPQVGAVSGPTISGPAFSIGGVTALNYGKAYVAATTTPCAIKSPIATSTLVLGSGAVFSTSSTTATVVGVYKSATPYAATTFLFGANVAANAQAAVVATTSADTFTFAPNQYLVVKMSGGTGNYSPVGRCNATFREVSA